jgi:hypothetical protein
MAVVLSCLAVDHAKRIHHILKTHELLSAWDTPQGWCRFHCARVGGPRRQDCALFIHRQIGGIFSCGWLIYQAIDFTYIIMLPA